MMSARTSFLVWWGLPVLCGGFGAMAAAYLGEGGMFGRRPGQIGPLMLVGGYFLVVGLLAVVFRMRQNQASFDERDRFDKPVEAAMVALCVPILVAGVWLFAAGLKADLGPSRTVTGALQSIDKVGAFGRSFGIDLESTASPMILQCRLARNCGSPTPLMRLQPGTSMEIQVVHGKVLGLKAGGRQLVDPAVQRTWRVGLGAAGLVALLLYGAAFTVAAARLLFQAQEPQPEPPYWTAS
ncbi:hypothetical protein [Phenylobacterium sp.]|uniref:hypothetical protein n=1 Tax=Phenylobacterium sp. TaxID=1871053 RepID=UPI0028A19DCB|nr:hypothetical protein [Phenylobacterium sp.]